MIGLWLAAAMAPLGVAGAQALVGLAPDVSSVPVRRVLTWLAPLAVLPVAVLGLVAPGGSAVEVSWLLVGTTFSLDHVGRALLVMTAMLYGLALLMVARSADERATALSGLLLLCFTANAGVFVAADVVTLYLCFTVMSLVGYALVIHDRSSQARRAGRIYLILAVTGEAAVLVAAMLAVFSGGLRLADTPAAVAGTEHTELIVALLWVGFGIKAGVIPLHVWLPLAHPAAPTPASAVLSGAMITAGLAGWLRMLPLGEVSMTAWGLVFIGTGLAGAYLAVLAGVVQRTAKAALAYSSVSQMGLLSVVVGAGLLVPDLAGLLAATAVVYAAHHGLVKAALFFGVGLWGYHGAGPAKWVVLAGMAVAGLALAGWPFTSGYLAKYATKDALAGITPAGVGLDSLLVLVGTGSTLLVARALWLLRDTSAQDRRWGPTLTGWLGLIGSSFPFLLWAARLGPEVTLPGWSDPSAWWSQGWPVLLGVGLVAVVLTLRRVPRASRTLARPRVEVPPGDVVVLEERAAALLADRVGRLVEVLTRGYRGAGRLLQRIPSPAGWVNVAEQHLAVWRTSGTALLGMVAVLLMLVWWGR